MQSFGLWYSENDNKKNLEAKKSSFLCKSILQNGDRKDNVPSFSVHINLWFLEDIRGLDKAIKTPYLDVGIKIKNYKSLKRLAFYCPFPFSKYNIEDLSPKLSNKSAATMIFNDDCEITTIGSYTSIHFSDPGKKEILIFLLDGVIEDLYSLECDNILNFEFEKFHTYVGSGNSKLEKFEDIYIRFRIKDVDLKNCIYFDSELLNKSLESAFSGTRIIDFKINEKRNIPEHIQAKMAVERLCWVNFEKIHFLVMEPSSYDLTSFSDYKMTCREMEEKMWDHYLDAKIYFSEGHVLAYHWRGDNLKEFSCFAKVNYSKARVSTLTSYIVIVVLLGLLGSSMVELVPVLSKWVGLSKEYGILGMMAIAVGIIFVLIFRAIK